MLCSKLKQIVTTKPLLNNNVHSRRLLSTRFLYKRFVLIDEFLSSLTRTENMSAIRFMLRDLSVNKLWSSWRRSFFVNNVVRKCRRDRSVREVIQCFRQAILRPRRTLLLSATAAYKSNGEEDSGRTSCDSNITDEDLEALLTELEGVAALSRSTLVCGGCGGRLVIDKKHPGIRYCACKHVTPPAGSPDGWVPYMEAEDVIIWRKEYKPGQGLYAYKVYGRYKDVQAKDFAAVQTDSAYRRHWDAAVAGLAVVEARAYGVDEQAVLHWEVLWPRLFANRDYVYIRRHKEYNMDAPAAPAPSRGGVGAVFANAYEERQSVHSNAKRRAREQDKDDVRASENKAYVIVSRSCEHPKVPESKHAIRVTEYWSHMVVKSLEGSDKAGMEFVLTYYDEPAAGGVPGGVAAWATGRAAPAYLLRMRTAAAHYRAWAAHHQEEADSPAAPCGTESGSERPAPTATEQDMESSKLGPEMGPEVGPEGAEVGPEGPTREQATQTDTHTVDKAVGTRDNGDTSRPSEQDGDKAEDEENNGRWWRYLYPFYYFV